MNELFGYRELYYVKTAKGFLEVLFRFFSFFLSFFGCVTHGPRFPGLV